MNTLKTRNTHTAMEWFFKKIPNQLLEDSRNGPVRRFHYPVTITYTHPWERVNMCPVRDCNPFFHLLESIWMMAGRNDVEWIRRVLPGMAEYSDDGLVFNGAYGHRLLRHFKFDQLTAAANELKLHPESRRAVATIWKPDDLIIASKDKPCNLQLVFSDRDGYIFMTVFNRSNDGILGGVCGANLVHLSLFHEYVAAAAEARMGEMIVISNNLHAYVQHPKYQPLVDFYQNDNGFVDPYAEGARINRIVGDWSTFQLECRAWCDQPDGPGRRYRNRFLARIATPMYEALFLHKRGQTQSALNMLSAHHDGACDWIESGIRWLQRRYKGVESKHASGGW